MSFKHRTLPHLLHTHTHTYRSSTSKRKGATVSFRDFPRECPVYGYHAKKLIIVRATIAGGRKNVNRGRLGYKIVGDDFPVYRREAIRFERNKPFLILYRDGRNGLLLIYRVCGHKRRLIV